MDSVKPGNRGFPEWNLDAPIQTNIEGRQHWKSRLFVSMAAFWLFGPNTAEPSHISSPTIRTIFERNFVVHTDLAEDETTALIARMNVTLHRAEKYWGYRLPGRIECYVVSDLQHWNCQDFPDQEAAGVLQTVGGATQPVASSREKSRHKRARIYATTATGVVQHEVIHAYCLQTFGTTGPCWYREGMAQFGSYDRDTAGNTFPPHVVQFLQNNKSLCVEQIVQRSEFTNTLVDAAKAVLDDNPDGLHGAKFDHPEAKVTKWTKNLDTVLHQYWESWALCYFLDQHPHYHKRFRLLGDCYMRKQQGIFSELFGPVAADLAQDFSDFVTNL